MANTAKRNKQPKKEIVVEDHLWDILAWVQDISPEYIAPAIERKFGVSIKERKIKSNATEKKT